MSKRVRFYVALVIAVLLAYALTTVAAALDWNRLEMYAVGAGLLVVLCPVAMSWMEMAPDGAWRGRPPR
jgi:asparagine N-glycosylation enzyme membrane subunit Stt3